MFVGLSGVLQGIIILKKARGDERRGDDFCFAGTEPALKGRAPAKQKAKGSSWMHLPRTARYSGKRK
jgi:hypothetical protein